MKRSAIRLLGPFLCAVWSLSSPAAAFEFHDQDRVVFVGGAFMERLQAHDFLETILSSAHPHQGLTFRNLGWSGDTVFGEARAVFGTAEEGFQRLEKDLLETRPTVIIACYGNNEAHAGEAGLETFRRGVERLCELFQRTSARVVFVSPRPYETLGPPLPNPAPYNRTLRAYADVWRQAAAERSYAYVNIFDEVGGRLTDNGLHLTEFGQWRMASRLARELGVPPQRWSLDVDWSQPGYSATDVLVQEMDVGSDSCRFTVRDRFLPPPPPPATGPNQAHLLVHQGWVRVRHLPRGTYRLKVNGTELLTALSTAWEQGRDLPWRGGGDQVEALRRVILEKNQLCFHRYRPQNETYLFLFRKHEQGNNAVEIPQFDPLIAEREAQIRELLRPNAQTYELVRVSR